MTSPAHAAVQVPCPDGTSTTKSALQTADQACAGHLRPAANSSTNSSECPKPRFFGLVPWYEYLKLNNKCDITSFNILPDGSSVHSDIPLVLLAIVDDLLRIAGLVAVGFVIYGGIEYILSQGNPDGTAKAQTTLLNALIGLAIAMTAVVAVGFLGGKLGG